MNSDKRFIKRLTRREFADALRKGLGRALLHVLRYSLNDVADLVLEACLHNQVYDVQCESSRAAWLVRMFCDSPKYSEFSQVIRSQLKDMETEDIDVWQLCELVKEMAAQGDAAAREELGEYVREQASLPFSDGPIGDEYWIDLEGWEALLELAKTYGHRVLLDPQDEVPDYLLYRQSSFDATKRRLFEHAQTDPDVQAYWDYLEAKGMFDPPPTRARREAIRERNRKEYTVESILQDARNNAVLQRYTMFGRHATADELKGIYAHLVKETDQAVLLRLLKVFREAPLPELNEMFFRWADETDDELRSASIAALAHTTDERVHELAKAKARAGHLVGPDCEALRLFLNNYTTEDARLITQALSSLGPDPNDVHRPVFHLAELAEKVSDVALADALKWGYENTPCTNCRYRMVKQLSLVDRLDETTRYECEYDCAEEIRAFAKSLPITGFEPTEHRGIGPLHDWNN